MTVRWVFLLAVGLATGVFATLGRAQSDASGVGAEPGVVAEDASVEELFREANRAYELGLGSEGEARETRLRTAASLFERLVDERGIANGYLYYNLGNAYVALGEIGRGILAYRRAERLIPSDPELAENLEYAIRRRIDASGAGPGQLGTIVKTLSLRAYWFDFPTSVRILLVLSVVLWVWLSLRWFRRPAAFGIVTGVLLVANLVAAGIVVFYLVDVRTDRAGVIVADEAEAMKGPGRTYEPRFTEPLHEGTEFRKIGERGEWLHVTLDTGEECYIRKESAELVVDG